MSRAKSFVRGPSAYRRETPRHPSSGKAFLIVTEGEKTERNYFLALKDRLRLAAADVEIHHPKGTDPLTLVQKAIALSDARNAAAEKGFSIPYDEVWVVFDLEGPHDQRRKLAQQARQMKGADGIQFAKSDPCFEYWLLLHYRDGYTTTKLPDGTAAIKRLRKHWPNYSKGEPPPPDLIDSLPIAVTHAKQVRKHHKDSGGDGNPSTQADLLARSLNAATRPHLQFILP